MTSKESALAVVRAVALAIQELGSVPSGHLYARLMGHMSLESYQMILKILTDAKLIEVKGHVIHWKANQN